MYRYTSFGSGLHNGVKSHRVPHAPRTVGRGCRSVAWCVAVALAALLGPTLASAATITWVPTGDTAWATPGNWSGVTTPPTDNIDADIALFNSALFTNQPDAGTRSINGIQVGDGSLATGPLSITTAALSIGSGGILVKANAGTVSIGAVKLGASQNWKNDSSSLLTLSSTVTNAGDASPFVLTLNGTGSGGITFSDVISNGGATGTTALTVSTTGTGVTTLAGANTYSGATTLTTGILRLTNTAALTNSALKLNGGTLQLRSDTSATFADASTAISGTCTIDVNQTSSGASQTLSLGASSIAAGTILNVTGGNSYTLSLGTITVAGGTATFSPTTANLVTGTINFTGNGNLTKLGSGTWTLNGVASTKNYPGLFTVSAGTLKLGLSNAIANPSGYGVKVQVTGGFFDLAGYSETVGSLDTASTSGTITNSSSTTASTLTVDDQNQSGPTQTYPGILTDNGGSGKLNLTVVSKDSYGHSTTLTLSGTNNSYTGVTTVLGGKGSTDSVPYNTNTLSISSLANGGFNSSIGAATNSAANIVLDYGGTLKYTGAAVSSDRLFSIGGNYGGMIDASGTGPVNFTNTGTIGFNSSTNARYLALLGNNTGNNTLAATITNNTGATSVTKGGAGTWVLANAANSYTGATIVGGGVLNVPSLANGGFGSPIGAAAIAAGNLVLAGGTLQYTGSTAQSTDRLFTVAATGGTIDSSGSGTLSFMNIGINLSSDPANRSVWTNTATPPNGVSLVQSNMLATDLVAGMTVTGSGGTATAISTVNSPNNITLNGTLGTWATKTLSFSSVDRTLTLTGSNTGANTIAGILADSPTKKLSVAKTGAGQWVLGGANTYTGATNVNAGKLNITGSLAAGSVVNVAGGAMLGGSGNGASTGIINGAVTVAGGSASAAQGAIDLVDGSLGTLYLGSTLAMGGGTAGNPSLLNLEYSSAGFDKVAATGALTLNPGGGIINLTSLGTAPSLGVYDILTFASASGGGAFTFPGGVTTTTIGGKTYTLGNTTTAEQITVTSGSASVARFTLGLTATATRAHTGQTISLTSTINNNAGDGSSDSIDFSGLGVTAGSGTIGDPTANGAGNISYPNSVGTVGLTYSNAAAGNYLVTAAVASALNHSIGGSATQISAQSLTLNFYSGQSTWTGTGNGAWTDFANWNTNGGVPGIDGSFSLNDTATFGNAGITGPITVDLQTATPSISALGFNGNTSYTIASTSTGSLTLANAAGVSVSVAGVQSISAPLILNNNTTITTANGGDSLAVSGHISGNGSGSGATLTVSGPGSVTLSYANTYSGGTTVTGGTLQSGILNALPTGTALTVSGGVFDLNGNNQTLASLAGAAGGVVNNSSFAPALLTVNGSGTSVYGGVISNTFAGGLSLAKSGGGSLTLAGANTFSGSTTVSAGILQLANTAALSNSALNLNGGTLQLRSDASGSFATAGTTVGGTATIDVNQASSGANQTLSLGAVSITNGLTLNVTGGNGYTLGLGTVTITGSTPWVQTTINPTGVNVSIASINLANGGNSYALNLAGTSIGNTIAGSISAGSAQSLTKSGSGTWTLAGVSGALNGWPYPVFVSAGTLKLGVNNALYSAGGLNLQVNGGTFDLAGCNQTVAVLSNSAGGTITNSSTTPSTLTIDSQSGNFGAVYAGAITDNGAAGGTLGLTVSQIHDMQAGPATTLTLTGTNNTYTGVTLIEGGNPGLSTNNNVAMVTASALANGGSPSSIGASASIASNLVLDYAGALKYAGPSVSTDRLFSVGKNYGGMIDASGAGPVDFTNTGTIGFNGATGARYLALLGNNTGNNTLAAAIADNGGATSVTKAGSGTWLLGNSANSYTGPTIVGGGVLNVSSLGFIGLASNIGAGVATNDTANAASLVLSGGTLQYTGSIAQSTNRLFTIAASGGTIDASGTGSGTLSFTNNGANLSSDPAAKTTFNTGGAAEVFVQSNMLATDLVAGMAVTGGGVAGGTTIASVNSPTSITLSNAAPNWGNKTFTFGTANRTLTLTGSNTGDNTIAGSLADSAGGGLLSLAKTGTGTWVLANANTYSGTTAVTTGTLWVNGSIASTSVTVAPSAVLDLANTGGTALAAATPYASVTNNGTLNVSSLNETAGAISGTGTTNVTSSLTADSIVQGTLSIGSGGVVTIRETTGGSVNAVPEPSTLALLFAGAIGLLTLAWRRRKQTA